MPGAPWLPVVTVVVETLASAVWAVLAGGMAPDLEGAEEDIKPDTTRAGPVAPLVLPLSELGTPRAEAREYMDEILFRLLLSDWLYSKPKKDEFLRREW